MARIRLNEGYRDFLTTLAKQVVTCPTEAKAMDAAYKAAAAVVRGIIVARYPAKDMAVLQRYQKATPDDCIRLQLTAGGVREFKFRKEETAPLAPEGSCYGRMYQADADATKAIGDLSPRIGSAREGAQGQARRLLRADPWRRTSGRGRGSVARGDAASRAQFPHAADGPLQRRDRPHQGRRRSPREDARAAIALATSAADAPATTEG